MGLKSSASLVGRYKYDNMDPETHARTEAPTIYRNAWVRSTDWVRILEPLPISHTCLFFLSLRYLWLLDFWEERVLYFLMLTYDEILADSRDLKGSETSGIYCLNTSNSYSDACLPSLSTLLYGSSWLLRISCVRCTNTFKNDHCWTWDQHSTRASTSSVHVTRTVSVTMVNHHDKTSQSRVSPEAMIKFARPSSLRMSPNYKMTNSNTRWTALVSAFYFFFPRLPPSCNNHGRLMSWMGFSQFSLSNEAFLIHLPHGTVVASTPTTVARQNSAPKKVSRSSG